MYIFGSLPILPLLRLLSLLIPGLWVYDHIYILIFAYSDDPWVVRCTPSLSSRHSLTDPLLTVKLSSLLINSAFLSLHNAARPCVYAQLRLLVGSGTNTADFDCPVAARGFVSSVNTVIILTEHEINVIAGVTVISTYNQYNSLVQVLRVCQFFM